MKIKIIVLILICLILSSCSELALFANIEDLLRAPQVDEVQSSVHEAVNTEIGKTVQLKYPRSGDNLLPIAFADFDDDGEQEAVVLYSANSNIENVNLAIVEYEEEGWVVAAVVKGLDVEVTELVLCNVKQGGTQIAVGYANSNLSSKYLSVYNYSNREINLLLETAYSMCAFGNITHDDTQDLVTVPPSLTAGAVMLNLYSFMDEKMQLMQNLELNRRIYSCANLMITNYANRKGVVVDGLISKSTLATQVFEMKEGALLEINNESTLNFASTQRYKTELISYDIGNDGLVESPRMQKALATLSGNRRLYMIEWHNYFRNNTLVQCGVYDSGYGYYVRLPLDWQHEIKIDEGLNGTWQVRNKDTNALYLTIQVTDLSATDSAFTTIATIGSKHIKVMYSSNVSSVERDLVSNGVFAIN